MAPKLSCVFLMLTVLIFNFNWISANSVFLQKPAAYVNNPCADIRNGQFICADCKTLAYCMQEGGDWVTYTYAACETQKSMYCNEEMKGCNYQRECYIPSQGIKFECQNPGKYPDPYDCKKYHVCSDFNVDTRFVCPSGTIYSAAEKDCKQGATDSLECRESQFQCKRAGQTYAWPGDPNIYYVCHVKNVNGEKVYYPLMYRCKEGNIFDGINCVPGNSIVNTPSTQTNSPPNNSNNQQQTDACAQGKLIAHPTNCRAYYSCKNGKSNMEQCPPNTYFNERGSRCDIGNC